MSHHSRSPFLPLATVLCLAFFSLPTSAADVPRAALSGDRDQLVAEGWTETAAGVYQRTDDGRLLTLAYGDAGPRLDLAWLNTQIELLEESLALDGSPDTLAALRDLEIRRDELTEAQRDGVLSRRVDTFGSGLDLTTTLPGPTGVVGCDIQFSYGADAYPTNTGPRADAWVSFDDSCGRDADIECYTFARGYQRTQLTNTIKSDGPRTISGTGSCSVTNPITADNNCFANARARLEFLDDTQTLVTFSQTDSTQLCRPLVVQIDGSNFREVSLSYGSCATLAFTASSNAQNTTFTWQWDGSAFGTGQSYTKTLCNWQTSPSIASHTLTLTGTVESETDQDHATVNVYYEDGGSWECLDPKNC